MKLLDVLKGIIKIMKLTSRLLQKLIVEERNKLDSISILHKSIREGVRKALAEATPSKPGTTGSEAEGTLDVKKLADAVGVDDPAKLKTAITNLRADKRSPADNKIFGDLIAKLLDASPDDTTKAMNVMKKVSAEK